MLKSSSVASLGENKLNLLIVDAAPVPSKYQGQLTPSQKVFSKSDQKLAALIQGYKTRRILADH